MDAGIVEGAKQAIEVLLKLKGTVISLIPERDSATEQPSGGYDFAPSAPLAPQTFNLRLPNREDDGLLEGEGVSYRSFAYIMTGRHDCVVPLPCYWVDGSNRYRVERELVKTEYARKFAVRAYGPEPKYG